MVSSVVLNLCPSFRKIYWIQEFIDNNMVVKIHGQLTIQVSQRVKNNILALKAVNFQ